MGETPAGPTDPTPAEPPEAPTTSGDSASAARRAEPEAAVLASRDLPAGGLARLLEPFGLELREVPEGAPIPGSYWGAPEAGIRGASLFVRPDTPVHSALHEACHLICADRARRNEIDTDAGGTDLEEDAVCYLQLVLAEHLPGAGAARLMADMDAWGYSFRLGSTRAWLERDAGDARAWLVDHGLLTEDGTPTWRSRS
jgi:hypothetical protein